MTLLNSLNGSLLAGAVSVLGIALGASACAVESEAEEAESVDVKIERAMSAAPLSISADATIVDVDGTVLREGTNGWTCSPGIGLIPGDTHPMCNDAVWTAVMNAAASGESYTPEAAGISYMLQGDALVNNADPMATDPDDGGVWVQEGPHLMLLIPNADMLAGMSRDPFSGGPYVMWDNTPMVHVMVPVPAP